MKQIPVNNHIQIWVCVNERPQQPGALPSCGHERGMALYTHIQTHAAVLSRKLRIPVWVNRTLCQGFCHSGGVTITVEPFALKYQSVTTADLPQFFQQLEEKARTHI